jgi:hypothetical protein
MSFAQDVINSNRQPARKLPGRRRNRCHRSTAADGNETGQWPSISTVLYRGAQSAQRFHATFEVEARDRHDQNSSLAEDNSTLPCREVVMSPLFKRILSLLCPHRFSWPHSGTHGQDYQVCLICGTAFEYDTTTMRRTGRLVVPTQT